MAVTLLDLQNISTNPSQIGLVQNIYTQNPLMAMLPFVSTNGARTYSYNLIDDADGSTSRQVNSDFVEGTASFNTRAFALGILGGKAYVDGYIEATTAPLDMLDAQTQAKAKQTGLRFQYEFFNGDTSVDPTGFDGLKKLALGEDTTASTLALADVDLVLDNVNGESSALFMNYKTASALNNLAYAKGRIQYNDINLVGSRLTTYMGIPIVRTGKYNGADVLADGEIYAVRMGEDGVFGVQASLPTPQVFGPNSEKPGWSVRYDWYVGLAAKVGSVYRITRSLA